MALPFLQALSLARLGEVGAANSSYGPGMCRVWLLAVQVFFATGIDLPVETYRPCWEDVRFPAHASIPFAPFEHFAPWGLLRLRAPEFATQSAASKKDSSAGFAGLLRRGRWPGWAKEAGARRFGAGEANGRPGGEGKESLRFFAIVLRRFAEKAWSLRAWTGFLSEAAGGATPQVAARPGATPKVAVRGGAGSMGVGGGGAECRAGATK